MSSFLHNQQTTGMFGITRRLWLCMLGLVLVTSGCIAIFLTNRVSAQAPQTGQAFSISPPLIELKADPGKTVTAKIKLTNVSSGELLIKTQLNDFGAKNETGEPNIIFDDSKNTSYSLRQWIASPEPFRLASKQTKELEVPIAVPTDAEPGGHYAVIRFTGTAPELEQSGVALSASIGSLVLMQVSGDVKQKASVAEFYTSNARGEKTTFFETGPIGFVERIRNDGNVHIKPTGTIEVKSMFGKVISTSRVNGDPKDKKNPPKSALPGSIRRFGQTLDTGWMFGRYEARMNLSYGEKQPPLVSTVTFWVVPYKLILIVLLGAGIVGYLGWLGIRKYNAHIIRKATKNGPPVKPPHEPGV